MQADWMWCEWSLQDCEYVRYHKHLCKISFRVATLMASFTNDRRGQAMSLCPSNDLRISRAATIDRDVIRAETSFQNAHDLGAA
jgi:hypothetical protein